MPVRLRLRRFAALLLLTGVLLGAGGCGLKGPLYLPPPKPQKPRPMHVPHASTAARPLSSGSPR